MKKRILGVALAGALAFSAIAGSMITASSAELAPPNPNRLPEYKASAGVQTYNLKFALPGSWTGEENSDARKTWEKYGSAAGLYWWGSKDNPDDAPAAASHGWPGWKMKKDASIPNLYSTDVPKGTASMIFSNFIDGGMDTKYPEYNAAMQTEDLTMLEYFGEGDSDFYPKEFWDFVYSYQDDFEGNANFQIPGFGDYAKNFYFDADEECIFHYLDDMVFVTDYHIDPNKVSPVSGKAGFPGGFYFDYGNGEFGIWPTKAMCIEKEGLTVDDQGNVVYEGTKKDDNGNDVAFKETVDEKTGFVLREHTDAYDKKTKRNFVVFGNITGKYWGNTAAPEIPTNAPSNDQQNTTKVPDPSQDATSNSGSTSDSAGSNNGAIATGDFSAAALIGVVAIAGLGVFYFVRKRRSSK